MGLFERYMTLWVGPSILLGVLLGNLLPGQFAAIAVPEWGPRQPGGGGADPGVALADDGAGGFSRHKACGTATENWPRRRA